jgi:hypothetical protein
MSSNNLRDMYNEFAAQGISVPAATLILNSALKSAAEFGIEKILGKVLGGTALDDIVFGRTVGKSTGKTLSSSGIKRLLKDAGQEGMEEVLQEFSGFMIDDVFSRVVSENFGELNELSFQSFFDAFVIGAIVSIGGSIMIESPM